MDDDFVNKIEQLKDMLNKPAFKENIENIMSLIPNTQDTQADSSSTSNQNNNETITNTIKKVMEKRPHVNDPRTNLLNAIKPYLNPKRQQRIDSYAKILNVTMLSKFFND